MRMRFMGSLPTDRFRSGILLFAAIALMLAAGLGLRDPWPADEPRFALIARHMVESGQFLFPRRGVELYSDKPPLFMWLQAASYYLVGNWRIAFLLPSLLASLGTLWLVFDLARRVGSQRAALLATACCATTLQFTFQAKGAQIDPVLVFWVTLGNYGLLRHFFWGPRWDWYAVGWFAAGLGIATKGVGVLVLLLLPPYLWARYKRWPQLAPIAAGWRWGLGPLALLAALALWLLPMLHAVLTNQDPQLMQYAQDLLLRQTAGRYADPWHHIKPFYYFLGVILTSWWPVTAMLPAAIPALYRRARQPRTRIVLPVCWVLLVMAFFSMSPGKRDMYILPALPTLCAALSPLLPGLLRQRSAQTLLYAVLLLIATALLAAAGSALGPRPLLQLPEATGKLWALLAAMGACGVALLLRYRRARIAQAWFWFCVALWTLYGFVGYPLLNEARSAKGVMRQAAALTGPDQTLGMVGWKEQNYLQAAQPVVDFGYRKPVAWQMAQALRWLQQAPHARKIFTQRALLGVCIDARRVEEVGTANRRTWVIFGIDAVNRECRESDPSTEPN